MKTRNQKKRIGATKDKYCSKKPNQQHCADPGNDAVEVGEMVTMDVHSGAGGSVSNSSQTSDYRHLAWLLREKLNDLVDGGNGEFLISQPGLQSLLDMAASSNIVSVDPEVLNPILWRTLPKELLQLVLARLPLPDITRLRSLSRGWKREFATVNSDINRACDDAGSTMVALLSHSFIDAFFVTIYNITKSRWQSAYHLHLRRPSHWNHTLERWTYMWTPVDECDGGLVCFISLWKITPSNRLRIVVVNLFTRVQHELPPLHYQYKKLPTMVQIKVDSHTKHYKVVVATERESDLTIETYDSKEKKWIRVVPSSGSIIGSVYTWDKHRGWFFKLSSSTPRIYDFGEGKLQPHIDFRSSNMRDWRLIDMALEKDHMFYLQEKRKSPTDTSLGRRSLHSSFHIEEYHLDSRTKAWVKGKSYECPPFEDRGGDNPSVVCLNTCDGFLMVIFHYARKSTCFRLLDLSTSEWRNVPTNPNSVGRHTTQSVLCRAFWNAIP